VIVERVAYREMFLTGQPPAVTDTHGAGAEVGALALEMEEIVEELQSQNTSKAIAG
jgi:hypothetical protein